MRVLLISHTCQSASEGQPKARWLAREPDIELKVLVPHRWKHYGRWRRPDPVAGSDFDLHVGHVRWPWLPGAQSYLHYYPELGRIYRDFKPDVIDLWEEPWALVSVHACLLRNRLLPNAKIISETEQNVAKVLPPPFESFRRFTLKNCDYAVARSSEALTLAHRKGCSAPSGVVPNAVDPELFRPLESQAPTNSTSSAPSAFRAGYIGRLVEEKGLLDFVDAMAVLPSHARGEIVGDGPLRDTLQSRIDSLGLGGRVAILPARSATELPAVINSWNVLVLPSQTTARWKEQFGRVIIEAHACGVPVVGSDSGAIPEVIGNGGLVFPERNPRALADALLQLAANPEDARQKGLHGLKQVHERYTWQRVAQRMASIYRNVWSTNPPPLPC